MELPDYSQVNHYDGQRLAEHVVVSTWDKEAGTPYNFILKSRGDTVYDLHRRVLPTSLANELNDRVPNITRIK